jgi:hypothetical protein
VRFSCRHARRPPQNNTCPPVIGVTVAVSLFGVVFILSTRCRLCSTACFHNDAAVGLARVSRLVSRDTVQRFSSATGTQAQVLAVAAR